MLIFSYRQGTGVAIDFTTATGIGNPSPANNEYFGSAVGISGSRLIVGAYGHNSASGEIHIFDVPSQTLLETKPNPTVQSNAQFGVSVAASNAYLAAGAPYQDISGQSNAGIVYIYDASTLSLVRTLDNPNPWAPAAGDRFGQSVAVNSQYALVGAVAEDASGKSNAGRAYVFDISTGTQVHEWIGEASSDQFGTQVAMTENYAVVSAPYKTDGGFTNAGRAYIYDLGTGNLLHTLNTPSPAANDYFGWSVGITDTYTIIGAYGKDIPTFNTGIAYIFSTTTGTLLHTLTNPNAYDVSAGDQFGWAVGINNKYAIVGANFEDDAGGASAGKAYVFDPATGALLETIDDPNLYNTTASDQFGSAIAIDSAKAVIGAQYERGSGNQSLAGAVYLFE